MSSSIRRQLSSYGRGSLLSTEEKELGWTFLCWAVMRYTSLNNENIIKLQVQILSSKWLRTQSWTSSSNYEVRREILIFKIVEWLNSLGWGLSGMAFVGSSYAQSNGSSVHPYCWGWLCECELKRLLWIQQSRFLKIKCNFNCLHVSTK